MKHCPGCGELISEFGAWLCSACQPSERPMAVLQQLVQGCGASVEIEINCHKNACMTVREYLSSSENKTQIMPPEQMIQSMEQADSVVGITFYPLTPVSYEHVWHFDVEIGLIVALTKFLRIKG